MDDNSVFKPGIEDSKDSKFKHANDRRVELALQQELNDVARRTLLDLTAKKQTQMMQPLEEPQKTARKLKPQFVPQKTRRERKSHPIFLEDPSKPKSPKPTERIVNVPSYNALEKNVTAPPAAQTRKLPYSKEEVTTTKEMKKPKVSSVGVFPPRESAKVPGLKVVMEGKKAVPHKQGSPILDVREANKLKDSSNKLNENADAPDVTTDAETTSLETEKMIKPMIAPYAGTTGKAMYTERDKPPPRPRSQVSGMKTPRKIAASDVTFTPSSLRSGYLELPDDSRYSLYDDSVIGSDLTKPKKGATKALKSDDEDDRSSTASSVKSVKELMEEAKSIASSGHLMPKPPTVSKRSSTLSKKSSIAPAGAKKKKGHGQKEKQDGRKKSGSEERSVDEIISSLRNMSESGTQSEADKKIQEIMDRVMTRTSNVLADIGNKTGSPVDSEEPPIEDDDETVIKVDEPIPEEEEDEERRSVAASEKTEHEEDQTVPEAPLDLEEVLSQAELNEPVDVDMVIEPPAVVEDVPERFSVARSVESFAAPQEPVIDLKWAYDALVAPSDVYYEDIINMDGRSKALQQRSNRTKNTKSSEDENIVPPLLSTWTAQVHGDQKSGLGKSVHHFCTVREGAELPKALMHVGRKYHTPSQYINVSGVTNRYVSSPTRSGRLPSALYDNRTPEEESHELHKRQSQAAENILDEAYSFKDQPIMDSDSLEAWAARADQVIDNLDLGVAGSKMPIRSDESRLYWTPAPPKLDIPPSKIQKQLFAEYRGMSLPETAPTTIFEGLDEEYESDDETVLLEDPDEKIIATRIIQHRWKSHEDLSKLEIAKRDEAKKIKKAQEGGMQNAESVQTFATMDSIVSSNTDSVDTRSTLPPGPRMSVSELRQYLTQPLNQSQNDTMRQAGIQEVEHEAVERQDVLPLLGPLRRTISAPSLLIDEDDFAIIPQDYSTAMAEIKHHRFTIQENIHREEVAARHAQRSGTTGSTGMFSSDQGEEETDSEEVLQLHKKSPVRSKKPTPAELALQAGRSYVLLPPKKKKKKVVDMSRIEDIENFIKTAPNKIKRSKSLRKIKKPVERALRVPPHVRSMRRRSLTELDFKAYKKEHDEFFKSNEVEREQVRDIWNTWFDEVYPEPKSEVESSEDEAESEQDNEEEKRAALEKAKIVDTINYREVSSINLIIDNEEDEVILEVLQEQIDKVNEELEKMDRPSAFYLSRRGALYRKIGKIKQALADLDKAIELEPMLLDAYWHRHLIHLLQGSNQSALEDINFLLKHNRFHQGAYRSRAEIYKKQGDTTMTIINYTQAIKINPKDDEAYFLRAEMYEKRKEMLLAMEDYAIATRLAPHKTEAIMRHALYYFKNENWQAAVNDFSELLKVEPLNASARMYRGRAYSKMSYWNQAVEDLSAAIHLDPDNSKALYYRGCILRKCHPKKALQDFSISILLDDSEGNYQALLHRGILYNAIGKPEDAIPDFEAVLKLSNDIALAHVNLGLIYMTKMDNYQKAIKKFTGAIKVDPTYVRAYVCRAEAYHKIHDAKNALLDFTRAIHIRPDIPHYYMYRGQLVLELGNLELAAFCVRHASEFNVGITASPTQTAVVQSFLKNYDKAIDALQTATRSKPIPSLFVLLGKTQMKAKLYKDAAESFDKALGILKPWQPAQSWPKEAAEVNHMIGLCFMELRNYLGAHDAFNNAVKIDQNHAEAYYQRGMSRLRLKNQKGILDLNKALAINPTIFQAYLSRATFYGMHKRYSKAIMNCNEALKLQPKSVRAYLYRGALKYHIKAYTLAVKDLSKAAEIDSVCALAYFNRAVCHHDSGNYSKALQDYGIVLMLGDDMMLKVLINRGLLYYQRKDFQNALYDFLLAAKVDPLDSKIHHTLGLCYHKLGKLQKAVQTFSAAIKWNKFFLEAYLARGNVFMDYGHLQGIYMARHDYERALHLAPTFLPARINLAYSLQVEGKFQQAWNQFTMALAIDQNYKPAFEGRAIINLQMSSTDAALQDICSSIRVKPTAELYTNRGVIHQFMNDKPNAMRDYQTALRIDPKYSLAYFNAANMYFHTRQFGQAKQFYDSAIAANPEDESALLNRAITKVILRDSKGAIADFQAALKLSPHSSHIYFNRGNFFSSLSKFDLAENDYSQALKLQPDDALVLKRRADVRGKQGKREEAIADYKTAIDIQGRKQAPWKPSITA